MDKANKAAESEGNKNRMVRMLRLFRLLKLLRLVRIKRILDRWEEEMYGARALRIGKLVFIVLASSHWISCGWYFTGNSEGMELDGTISTKGWVKDKFPEGTDSIAYGTLYFCSYIWSSMAVLMVGTNDEHMTPHTANEKLMYCISYMVGAFVMSVIIGQVSDMIAHANPGDKARGDAIGLVHGFLHERNVSPFLTRRIRKYVSDMYSLRGTTDNIYDLMKMIPEVPAYVVTPYNVQFEDGSASRTATHSAFHVVSTHLARCVCALMYMGYA